MKNLSETLYGHLLLYKDGRPGKASIGILKISYGHNGLIEDSNLKYNIVNLQSSFRSGNLIGEGAAEPLNDCKFICKATEIAPRASHNSLTLILMLPVQSISVIFMVVILCLQRSFKLY